MERQRGREAKTSSAGVRVLLWNTDESQIERERERERNRETDTLSY